MCVVTWGCFGLGRVYGVCDAVFPRPGLSVLGGGL